VVNYVRDNLITITINADDLPDWIDDKLLGIDVMFDEQTYREMDHALKTMAKAEDNRLAVLRDILAGNDTLSRGSTKMRPLEEFLPSVERAGKTIELPEGLLNEPQQHALRVVESNPCVSLIHGPPGTGKTTTLVEAIIRTLLNENQVLVCAPSNAAIDLLVEKLSERRVNVVRIGHPARVTEGSLSKTLDARKSSVN